MNDVRPCAGTCGRLRPCLPHQGGEHARLRERGFADTRIAEKNRKLVRRRRKRPDHFDGFAPSAEEEVAIGFGHGGKAAIGRGVSPQARPGAAPPPAAASITWARLFSDAGSAVMIQCNCRRNGSPGAGWPSSSTRTTGKSVLLHAPVERFVIFGHLPRAEPLLADQQHEDRGLGDFVGELGQPEAAGPQALRGKENLRLGVLALERRLEDLHAARDPGNCSSETSAAFKAPMQTHTA